jgi:hypothetical protein
VFNWLRNLFDRVQTLRAGPDLSTYFPLHIREVLTGKKYIVHYEDQIPPATPFVVVETNVRDWNS